MPFVLAVVMAAVLPLATGVDGPSIRAIRSAGAVQIDGKLDEPAWRNAPEFEAFVQIFPSEGAPPTERTELRVLYDDQNVYVGFICHDSRPGEIVRNLGRRDRPPLSDTVEVAIDSSGDNRTAYSFGVNAGGVLFDSLLYDDSASSMEWDAVWDAAVRPLPDGWSAELVIPLHVLRFSAAEAQTWGLLAKR